MEPGASDEVRPPAEAATGPGKRLWILIALGVVILAMIVALIAISVAEGRAIASLSSIGIPTLVAILPCV